MLVQRILPVVFAIVQCTALIAASPDGIFWTHEDDADNGAVRYSDSMGNQQTIISGSFEALSGIAVDPTTGQMFWGFFWEGQIMRSSVDGQNTTAVISSGNTSVWDIEVDHVAKKLYWTDPPGNAIRRSNYDGSNVETVLSGLQSPVGVDLDLQNRKLYWTEEYASMIRRSDLDGSNMETVLQSSGFYSNLQDIELDVANNMMYWTETTTNRIGAASMDGSGMQYHFAGTAGDAYGLALDLPNNQMYWATWDGNIMTADLGMTHMEVYYADEPHTWGIALVPEPISLGLLLNGILAIRLCKGRGN